MVLLETLSSLEEEYGDMVKAVQAGREGQRLELDDLLSEWYSMYDLNSDGEITQVEP